jgi:hypothetical protein
MIRRLVVGTVDPTLPRYGTDFMTLGCDFNLVATARGFDSLELRALLPYHQNGKSRNR